MLYQHYLPIPSECWPVAEECKSICDQLAGVLGEHLADKYALDTGTSARAYNDPLLTQDGPDLPRCAIQIQQLALAMRTVCERIAADTTAIPNQRRAADRAAWTANFVWTQYMAATGI